MTSISRVLAGWLTPVALLAVPAALCGRAADGLWLGLTWALVPLIVLGLQAGPRPGPAGGGRDERGSLFPVVILLLIHAGSSRLHRTSFLAISLAVIALLSVFHRSFLLALVVLVAYALSRVRWPHWDNRVVRFFRSSGYTLCLAGLVVSALVGGISQITPRESDYSSGALFHGTSLEVQLANLLIDYGSSLGAEVVLAPLGLWVLLRKARWQVEDRIMLAGLFLYAPLLGAGQYTILVVLPFLAVFTVLGMVRASRRWLARPPFVAALLTAVIIASTGSAVYMVDRWQENVVPSIFVDPDVFDASVYLRSRDPGVFFVSNDWSSASYKIWSLSGNPAVSWDLAIPLSEGVLTPEDLRVEFHLTPLSFYEVTSGLYERTHWVSLMTTEPLNPQAQYVIHLYNVRYFVKSKTYLDPSTVLFENAIELSEYKVWSSPTYDIWVVPQV